MLSHSIVACGLVYIQNFILVKGIAHSCVKGMPGHQADIRVRLAGTFDVAIKLKPSMLLVHLEARLFRGSHHWHKIKPHCSASQKSYYNTDGSSELELTRLQYFKKCMCASNLGRQLLANPHGQVHGRYSLC